MNLAREAAYSGKTPYDLWQDSQGIPIFADIVSRISGLSLWPRGGLWALSVVLLIWLAPVGRAVLMCAKCLRAVRPNRNVIFSSSSSTLSKVVEPPAYGTRNQKTDF